MQIITGKYRARKLVGVEGDTTRPTLARVKESIFNLIQWEIEGSIVLDLFAGSGAFGAECISRGAIKVFFVDKAPNAISAIKVNTKNMQADFEIIKNDFANALMDFSKNKIKFDIIYLDPPYNSDFAMQALQLIARENLLAENGTIVVEHEYENDLQNLDNYYIIERSKKYGIAYVDIIKENKE